MNTATPRPANLRDSIYRDIRDRLHEGAIAPDDRLVDTDIAARLGVSRMPVREALLKLTHEGYLVGTTRGFMLPSLTRRDIAEIFEVRRLLEPRAAGQAARDLDAAGLERLTAARDGAVAAVAAGDVDALYRANVAFRAGWLAAVANSRLAETIARFADHVQTVRLATLRDGETHGVVVEGLSGLLDAFANRDPIAAADRMRRFIDLAEERFTALARREAGDAAPGGERKTG